MFFCPGSVYWGKNGERWMRELENIMRELRELELMSLGFEWRDCGWPVDWIWLRLMSPGISEKDLRNLLCDACFFLNMLSCLNFSLLTLNWSWNTFIIPYSMLAFPHFFCTMCCPHIVWECCPGRLGTSRADQKLGSCCCADFDDSVCKLPLDRRAMNAVGGAMEAPWNDFL